MLSASIVLPGTDIAIPPLGVGTWAWGDKATWGMGGYDAALSERTIREAWDASLDAGVTFFDTAEVYGGGESERIIGRLLAEDRAAKRAVTPILATKFLPSPWKLDVKSALLASLRASLERLGVEKVHLYQIHGPISLRSHGAMADALAAGHEAGPPASTRPRIRRPAGATSRRTRWSAWTRSSPSCAASVRDTTAVHRDRSRCAG
jgi:aryl-alcohol dehydrogenase-like predicted oxidoreductase